MAKCVELTQQNMGKVNPHVTVQNKVREEELDETLRDLKGSWDEWRGRTEGITL